MTIEEYIVENNTNYAVFFIDGFVSLRINHNGNVELYECVDLVCVLKHIKTMEQFSQLCELLTGKPFDYE